MLVRDGNMHTSMEFMIPYSINPIPPMPLSPGAKVQQPMPPTTTRDGARLSTQVVQAHTSTNDDAEDATDKRRANPARPVQSDFLLFLLFGPTKSTMRIPKAWPQFLLAIASRRLWGMGRIRRRRLSWGRSRQGEASLPGCSAVLRFSMVGEIPPHAQWALPREVWRGGQTGVRCLLR